MDTKPKNLVNVVSTILNREVTEHEAKEFALNQFGLLCAYIRSVKLKD